MAPNSQNTPNKYSKKFKSKSKMKNTNFKTPIRPIHRSRSRKRTKEGKIRERKDKSRSRKQSKEERNRKGTGRDFEQFEQSKNASSNNKYENLVTHYLSKLKNLFSTSSTTTLNSSSLKSIPRSHSCNFQQNNVLPRQRQQAHSDESLLPYVKRKSHRSPSPYPHHKSSTKILQSSKERDVKKKAYKVLKAALAYGFANDLLEKRGDFFALRKFKSVAKRRSPTPAPRSNRPHSKYFEPRPSFRDSNDYLKNNFNNIDYDSKSIHEIQKYSKKMNDNDNCSSASSGEKMYENDGTDFCYYCNRFSNMCNCNSSQKN